MILLRQMADDGQLMPDGNRINNTKIDHGEAGCFTWVFLQSEMGDADSSPTK